jgi:protein gp37
MAETAIEWATHVWNPTTGCDQVSPGCDNCYAKTLAKRLQAMGNSRYTNDGDPRTSGPGFKLTMHWDKLDEPLHWSPRKPRRVFVNSMSDLFHDDVTMEFTARAFASMAAASAHTFMVLTKRPQIMASRVHRLESLVRELAGDVIWPLPNIWLGTSVEDQERAQLRIPKLLQVPAAVRFLSCEPLLGPVELASGWHDYLGANADRIAWTSEPDHAVNCEGGPGQSSTCTVPVQIQTPRIDWVIVGGESGNDHRPFDQQWARELRDQCVDAGVAYFFKQHGGLTSKAGGRMLDGREWSEFPSYSNRMLQPVG